MTMAAAGLAAWARAHLTAKKIGHFCYKQSLPLLFLIAITVGMAFPQPGQAVAHLTSRGWKVATTVNMSIIFFIFGVTLDARELSEAARAGRALSLGAASILFLTPLTGLLAARLPFNPKEFAVGLAVMTCAPTSLSSGVTLVGQGYGSGALALLLTVLTNVAGIATSPLMVKLALKAALSSSSSGSGARVDSADLLVKLGTSILAPLLFGKALREAMPSSFTRDWIPKCKPGLYLTSNLQIALIVWQKISAARPVLVEQELGAVVLASLAAIGWHFLLLAINVVACKLARLPEAERKAVVVMASQKNLPTAAVIISYFDPSSLGNLGLMTVPCVVWYVAQLFVDAYIASAWASKFERLLRLEEVYRGELRALAVAVGGLGVGGGGLGGGEDKKAGVGGAADDDKKAGVGGGAAAAAAAREEEEGTGAAPLLAAGGGFGQRAGDSAGEAERGGKRPPPSSSSAAAGTSTSVLASAALLRRRSSATAGGGERPQQQQQQQQKQQPQPPLPSADDDGSVL